jgi:hypothetical protein
MTEPTPPTPVQSAQEFAYDRLRKYVAEYAKEMWNDHSYYEGGDKYPTDEQCLTIELRSDGWANAHVEGQHGSEVPCMYSTAQECGERWAAAEFVECN